VNPKKVKVSGFPLPRLTLRSLANLPNSITLVLSSASARYNLAKRSGSIIFTVVDN